MSSPSCVVIDYGIGNVFSVMHALKSLGADAELTRDKERIIAADRVILPGVGAFGRAAEKLRNYGLDDTIREFIQTERPFLGICVGMQLLMSRSYEFGDHDGLNVIPGSVQKVDFSEKDGRKLRVPLIGWYPLAPALGQDAQSFRGTLLDGALEGAAYYFVHSFAVHPEDPEAVLATVMHDSQAVTAAIYYNNIVGLQFHPERSGAAGLSLLNRFLQR